MFELITNKYNNDSCDHLLDNLEDDFENSHTFVAQIFSAVILFFLLAFSSDLMIFGKKPNKVNIFITSLLFSLICFILSLQYFKEYYHDYGILSIKCQSVHKNKGDYPFRYMIPLGVSLGFIFISIGLIFMIIGQMI